MRNFSDTGRQALRLAGHLQKVTDQWFSYRGVGQSCTVSRDTAGVWGVARQPAGDSGDCPHPAPVSHSQPQGQDMADVWPLRSYLELGALPGAVPSARLHARQVLWEWRLPACSENAELLVCELMTNAIQASQSTESILPVRLWLSSDRSRLLIQVWDTSSHPPTRTDADGDDESGRGLLIVEAISTKWGWHPKEDQRGKMVWALIEI
jgi:anti-sigma regulatory factor (Ser/Thr protein kinase)